MHLRLIDGKLKQELFYGKVTFNKSKAAVRVRIVDFTAKALGSSSYRSAVKSGFNNTSIDSENRYAFKVNLVCTDEIT